MGESPRDLKPQCFFPLECIPYELQGKLAERDWGRHKQFLNYIYQGSLIPPNPDNLQKPTLRTISAEPVGRSCDLTYTVRKTICLC